jgi:tripartite-type tricarboxylate transporter receptor subunit TctC
MIGKLAAVATCLWLGLHPACAQNWPDKPIKLIVPTGAGAATDVMARLLANEVSKKISGSIYIENVAGGSGLPAHQAAARAEPDGYTFLFSNTSGLALNPVSFKQLPYDPAKDFSAVAMVVDLAPQMVSVHKDVPAKTLPELITYVKANPGKVSYGVDATAGGAVFFGKLLNRRAGLDMAEVPYRTAAQMVQDAAAARLPVLISSMTVAQPFVDTGELRQIALFSSRRFPDLPNLPTVSETLPGAAHDGFFVVVAPAKTPAPIIDRMNGAIGEVLKGEDIQKRLLQIGLATSGTGSPKQTSDFLDKERQGWRDLAKELGVEPQ